MKFLQNNVILAFSELQVIVINFKLLPQVKLHILNLLLLCMRFVSWLRDTKNANLLILCDI